MHVNAIVDAAIDTATGEVITTPGVADHGRARLAQVAAGARAATYEAGSTHQALARELEAAGINCVVAAPSKIRCAPGARVKNYKRHAELLAPLLLVGDITTVTAAGLSQVAARDQLRAHKAPADLISARHGVGKLLLRHGARYEGNAWT